MSAAKSKFSAVVTATILIVASVAGLSLARTDADETTLHAEFRDASPLIVGNDVKMHGVTVGIVDSIKVHEGLARVGIRLEDGATPIYRDARALIRPVGLLGERFVELNRGTPGRETLPVGGTIPASRTGGVTDLDQVLNTLDRPTGAGLAALVTTLGEGLTGAGPDAAAGIKALEPALTDSRPLVQVLEQQAQVLGQLVDSLTPVTQALAQDDGRQLDRLVGDADALLRVTADNERALDSTLVQLPSALEEARGTLRALDRAAASTTPTLRSLRPATDKLVKLSAEIRAFARAANPALEGLDPVLVQANAMLDHARPVLESLGRSRKDLSGTARAARPLVNALQGNIRNVLDMIKFWGLATTNEDGLSHYFRAHYVATDDVLTGQVPANLLPGGSVAPGDQGPGGPLPDVGGLLGGDGLLGGLLGGSLLGRGAKNDSATGLTSKQEQSLLDSLIGGS